MTTTTLADYDYKAPFPYFGGKSRVASLIWERFGNVPNYVEPFFGSGAVLLSRRDEPGTETVNDIDCLLANFWRALQHDPDGTARYADWPVNEADLLARHRWLQASEDAARFREAMRSDPDYFDVKFAGWWVWGACCWIGQGWGTKLAEQLPHVGNAGMGINRKLPHVGDAGMGINRKLPHVGDAGMGIATYFRVLSDRLRRVRVACGDWSRVLGDSVTIRHGITGVFLDPPYGEDADCCEVYANDSKTVARDVREWAIANGENTLYRIALCGYDGQHTMPDSWECVAWKTPGGYGSQGDGKGRVNASRERIWFSPHCYHPQGSLFEVLP